MPYIFIENEAHECVEIIATPGPKSYKQRRSPGHLLAFRVRRGQLQCVLGIDYHSTLAVGGVWAGVGGESGL